MDTGKELINREGGRRKREEGGSGKKREGKQNYNLHVEGRRGYMAQEKGNGGGVIKREGKGRGDKDGILSISLCALNIVIYKQQGMTLN